MFKIHTDKLGEVAQVFHPRTWEVQAREGQDHPSLNSKFEAWLQETLSLNKCCGLMRYTLKLFLKDTSQIILVQSLFGKRLY